MPYMANTTYLEDLTLNAEFRRNSDGRLLSSSSDTFYNGSFVKKAISRSGRNGKVKAATKDMNGFRLEWVVETAYDGPRLPYKIYVPRLKRHVWARKPIQVYRLRSVKVKPKKGMDLMPNPLTFKKHEVDYFGPGTITGLNTVWGYTRTHKSNRGFMGHLRDLHNSQFAGVNPQNYSNGQISLPILQLLPSVDKIAYSSFCERVKGQKVNLANILAERRQTVEMFAEGVTRAAQMIRALKAGDVNKVLSLLPSTPKKAANDFLMYQYGIKPLLSDLDGAMQAIASPDPQQFDVVGSHKDKVEEVVLHTSGGPAVGIAFSERVTTTGECIVKYKGRYRIDSVVRELSQLGFGNLASVLWEVTPYSFIIDWFLPIGDYLNNRDCYSGLTSIFAHRTVIYKEKLSFTRQFGGKDAVGYTWVPGIDGFRRTSVQVERSILDTMPEMRFPSFKDPVSEGHIMNAIALLTQSLSKGK